MNRNFLIVMAISTFLPIAAFSQQQGGQGKAIEMCRDARGQVWIQNDSGYNDCVDEAKGARKGSSDNSRGSVGQKGGQPKAGQAGKGSRPGSTGREGLREHDKGQTSDE
jgi:hypothetical protein